MTEPVINTRDGAEQKDINVPSSPRHPEANEEVKELPQGQFPDIDLGGLSQSDSDSDVGESEQGGFINGNTSHNRNTDNGVPAASAMATKNESQTTAIQDTNGVNNGDIEADAMFPSITPTFEQAYEDASKEFTTHKPITAQQQSRLVNYIDEELLKIQRKFVKTQSGQIRLSLNDILNDLLPLLKMIWLSITRSSNTTFEYFVRILTDLEEYFLHYQIPDHTQEFFETLQFIDVRISFLYDERICNRTQFIRILSVVSRLRILLISKLSNNFNPLIELESSKIFEGVLERS